MSAVPPLALAEEAHGKHASYQSKHRYTKGDHDDAFLDAVLARWRSLGGLPPQNPCSS